MSTAIPGVVTFVGEFDPPPVAENGEVVDLPARVRQISFDDLPRHLSAMRIAAGEAFGINPGFVYYEDPMLKKRYQVRHGAWSSQACHLNIVFVAHGRDLDVPDLIR